ncbi:MAG TPA: AmmeMemoRadiSam system protein B, partial [Candidatus Methylomirabilis sp.]|nr:AmmeMemoRadiSam system protein B [Candidatus Methylomirabilis sp.]
MISFTKQQERVIHQAASEMVVAAVMRRPARLPDATLGGAAQQIVMGAFVSVKRRGRLRGCCGLFGGPVSLGDAISQAARRTALEDARFPPVSPTELPYLDLEVWLLYNPQPVKSSGASRASEVIVGRHGLQIRRGSAGGLLLPGVAIEHQLDAEGFLEQVCLKADLPPTAWKEDDATLLTFEGHAISEPLDRDLAAAATEIPLKLLTTEDVARLAEHCRKNFVALVQGAMASCYALDCAEGTVHGISMAVHLPDSPEALRFSRLSLRPGLPLQATLHTLVEIAARAAASQATDSVKLAGISVDLTVLWDTAMHGTVMEPDLEGVQPAWRAVLVLEGGRSAWVFDPRQSSKDLLAQASQEAQVNSPATALVLSLATKSTEASALMANVPRPQMGPKVRPAAVAGSFYPGEAETLWNMVEQLLGDVTPPRAPWQAVMVPHAGLKYSGKIAAAVFQRVEIPEVVIILGPRHTHAGMEWAVAPHDVWSLPGATVASDPTLARQLAAAIPDLHLDALAHQREHCIEVQLPFLARLAPQTRVVGITLGAASLERCRQFASGLAEVLRQRADPPLLVISSDLNHYSSEAENRRLDALALTALESLNPATVFDTMTQHKISMCGLLPAVIVLETLHQLGRLRRAQRVAYDTSAAIT